MHVSVVIPTFNRAKLLNETIAALANQLTGEHTYEVIFVSNGSTDSSDVILKTAVADYPEKFRYFYIQPTGGPSAPRNVGIRNASGEIVIIIDDDVLPEPDFVRAHAEFHTQHPEAHHAALGEVYVPPHLQDDPMSLFHSFPYHQVRGRERLAYLYFWTCNVSVKRKFMLDCGMFDEEWLMYEDMLCGHRLENHGMHLHFLPAARGQHLHQLKAPDVPAKGRSYGRWLYSFVKHLPKPEVNRRFGILATNLPAHILASRLVMRLAFRLADNPATMLCLRKLGATNSKRNRITDIYYYIIFRRNMLAGYYEQKREPNKRLVPN